MVNIGEDNNREVPEPDPASHDDMHRCLHSLGLDVPKEYREEEALSRSMYKSTHRAAKPNTSHYLNATNQQSNFRDLKDVIFAATVAEEKPRVYYPRGSSAATGRAFFENASAVLAQYLRSKYPHTNFTGLNNYLMNIQQFCFQVELTSPGNQFNSDPMLSAPIRRMTMMTKTLYSEGTPSIITLHPSATSKIEPRIELLL